MRAKINVAIVQKETGHLVLKIFNGYGDPEIPFVADAVHLESEINIKPSGTDHKIGADCPLPAAGQRPSGGAPMKDHRLEDRAWRRRVGFDNVATDYDIRRAAFGIAVMFSALLAVAVIGWPK